MPKALWSSTSNHKVNIIQRFVLIEGHLAAKMIRRTSKQSAMQLVNDHVEIISGACCP